MRYLENLEFLPDDIELGSTIQARRRKWTLAAYLVFCCGILGRQVTRFPNVDLNLENMRTGVMAASLIIGLALFPPVMRWLNRKRRKPSWDHIVTAFSVGFFVDLSSSEVIRLFTSKALRILGG